MPFVNTTAAACAVGVGSSVGYDYGEGGFRKTTRKTGGRCSALSSSNAGKLSDSLTSCLEFLTQFGLLFRSFLLALVFLDALLPTTDCSVPSSINPITGGSDSSGFQYDHDDDDG